MNHTTVHVYDHRRTAEDAARRIGANATDVRAHLVSVRTAGAGTHRAVEAAIAGTTVRTAIAVAALLGLAVAGAATVMKPAEPGLALGLGITVALTGGLFAGGFAGFLSAWARLGGALALPDVGAGVDARALVVTRARACDVVPAPSTAIASVSCCGNAPEPNRLSVRR